MPVQPTYPGVYVQEVPSGVRTITGVSTSVAMFIGRTKQGPMNEPVSCLNFSDFERTFSSENPGSEMVHAVRLFFLNGGTQCYVMRIADGAVQASTTLLNEAGAGVLTVTAKSAGLIGNSIRLGVSYNTQYPESTFNLEVFRWITNGAGQQVKTDGEIWPRLSMDPSSARYVGQFINQNSKLINVSVLPALIPAANGYSQSGRPLRTAAANFRIDLGAAMANNRNRFRISVDGGSFANVDLSGLDLTKTPNNIARDIQDSINAVLQAGALVSVTLEAGLPNTNSLIRIASTNGDVKIEPASDKDLAQALMLGTALGGIEVSRFAELRPAPTGMVFKLANLNTFGALPQNAFKVIRINNTDIDLTNTLETVAGGGSMYQDGFTPVPSITGNNDGVREKWSIIANAINARQISDPNFRWSAQVWGSRLALIPGEGSDNSRGSIVTNDGAAAGTNIGPYFGSNFRYFSLGAPGGVTGNDGNSPTLITYNSAFEKIEQEVDIFNLMVLPKDSGHTEAVTNSLWGAASVFCQQRRAFLLMDAPETWTTVQEATHPANGVNSLRIGLVKDHSAIFYPRITIKENGLNVQTGPSGAIAGLMARTDADRGIWKAPAGTEADIRGITGLEYRFSDRQNGVLNPQGINTLRVFPNGIVNWGARTMDGDDDFASEWKYIPVRRTALFIEESLYRGLKWVVFEPNDEPLWAQIRLNVGAFMHNLFKQGAFQGEKKEAYFVKCDKETTTQNDINLGIVNVWVGFAPLKPAEFVIINLQQMTGQIQV